MSWFLRGVQSAIFHYASCAPCTGYADGRKRQRDARRARKEREKLVREQPETYYHPEPTGTNPYWGEEIALGPGPPPRRARRTNTATTGSTRGVAPVGTQRPVASPGGSSLDGERPHRLRLSDDTIEDDTWNLKRYQREDEHLWGLDDAPVPVQPTTSASSSSGLGSVLGSRTSRPGTSRSGSYYSARAPPVNDLHPPVVSLPSPDVADNRWMLQPPPKASVMSGKERATHRSRSGSGASSRVELSLQRQLSTRQLLHRLDRGPTQELPSLSPQGSHTDLLSPQPRHRSRTPQARPPSAASASRPKRRDTAVALNRSDTADSHRSSDTRGPATPTASRTVSVRQSRPVLSTVVSSGSGEHDLAPHPQSSDENTLPGMPEAAHYRFATQSSDSLPAARPTARRAPLNSSDLSSLNCLQDTARRAPLNSSDLSSLNCLQDTARRAPLNSSDLSSLNCLQDTARRAPLNSSDLSSLSCLPDTARRAPLNSSDLSSLNCLQDTVSPRALLTSHFISAPLVEAKIRRPPSNDDLAATARDEWTARTQWDEPVRAPFDSRGVVERDPRLRWSVDF